MTGGKPEVLINSKECPLGRCFKISAAGTEKLSTWPEHGPGAYGETYLLCPREGPQFILRTQLLGQRQCPMKLHWGSKTEVIEPVQPTNKSLVSMRL